MKTGINRLQFISIIIAIILCVFSGCSEKKEDGTTVTIGCNLPMTGIFSIYGESIRDGILMAQEDLKDSLAKYKVTINYDIQDNRSVAKDAQNIIMKQFVKPVDLYIGGIAQPLFSMLDAVEKKNVPFFAWGFEKYILSNYKNTYRTWVNLNAEAFYYIEYIKKVSPKKVFLIRPETVGSELQYNDFIIPFLKSQNIQYGIEVFSNDQKDFKNVVIKAKNYNPDLYIVNGFDFHIVELEKAFRNNNMISKTNTYWSLDLLDAAEKMGSNSLVNLRVTVPKFLINNSAYSGWADRFRKKYNRNPRYTDAYAYDMAFLVFNSVKSGKKATNMDEWRGALNRIDFNGITGNIRFREDRDLVYNLTTCIYVDGKLVIE